MNTQTPSHKTQSISITEYDEHFARRGTRILPGGAGTFWAEYETGAMMRMPIFPQTPPTVQEVRQVLWHGRAAIVSYLLEPDERHPANVWLYLCTDQAYTLEKLPPEMRRNAQRGLRELTITPLTTHQLLAHGAPAFCETRRRLGLNDGTSEEFLRRFTICARLPEYAFLGAWRDNQLAAYLSILEVEDWVEIEGT